MERERLRELAREMARCMGVERQAPPLRFVGTDAANQEEAGLLAEPAGEPEISRTAVLRRVRWLADSYDLQWLIDQAVWPDRRLVQLDTPDLLSLLADAERARECRLEGIGFDEAGLVRSRCG